MFKSLNKAISVFLCVFSVFLGLTACSSEPEDQRPYAVYVSANECNAEIRIFDSSGRQVGHDIYDCAYVQFCIFKLSYNGLYIAHADNGKTTVKETFVVSGATSVYLEF